MTWFVNGEPIDDNAVRDEAQSMRPRYMQEFADMEPIEAEMQLREWARENVIERMLLAQQARALAEPVPEEIVQQAIEAARSEAGGQAGCAGRASDEEIRSQCELQYRIAHLIEKVQTQGAPPRSKDVSEYYKKNKEHFRQPELIRAAHIVKNVNEQNDEASARSVIETALAELESGSPFHEVADRHSDCAGNGGDLGWFPRGEMVDEFDRAVFELPVGERTGIFRSPFGFHIATVLERKPAGIPPFAELQPKIEAVLTQQRRERALEAYLDDLRSKADVRAGGKAAG